MALTPAGYRLIQSLEGCRLQAYPDPAVAVPPGPLAMATPDPRSNQAW